MGKFSTIMQANKKEAWAKNVSTHIYTKAGERVAAWKRKEAFKNAGHVESTLTAQKLLLPS